jgi:pyruvate,orthophosphate dikinase
MTSHAAVVARGMGKCCVSGAGAVHVDLKARTMTIGDGPTTPKATGFRSTAPPARSTPASIATKDAELSGDFGA